MKKVFCLLLAVLMMAGMFAGCGGGQEEDPSTAPSTNPTSNPTPINQDDPTELPEVELPLTDDTVEFDYWYPSTYSFEDFNSYDDNLFFQWMEEQTNVHLNFIHPASGGATENFNTMILSGDYTDFIHMLKNYYSGGVDKAINDGVILRMNEKIDELMPHYRAEVYRDNSTTIECLSDAGNLWGISEILDSRQGASGGLLIRQDWLDKAGLTLADVETVDGLENALTKFVDYTYDHNGPLHLGPAAMGIGYGLNGSWNVAGLTAAGNSGIINKDGVATYTPMEPSFKEYIGKMADWYAKGLVSKNYVADNRAIPPDDRWVNSEVGVGEAYYTAPRALAASAATSELMPAPDFHLVAMTTPKLNEGDDWATDIHLRMSQAIVRNATCITTDCHDVDLACRYWDYAWTEEGKTCANWGPTVGEYGDADATYYIYENDENGDGLKECYQPWVNQKWPNASYAQIKVALKDGPVYRIWSREYCMLTPEEISWVDVWERAGCDWVWPAGTTLTADEGVTVSSTITACNTAVSEWTAAVITGQKSVDTYETELVPALESMNYQDGVACYQAALERFFARTSFVEE